MGVLNGYFRAVMINHSNYLIIYVILIISASQPFSHDAEILATNHFKIIMQNFAITVYISCEQYISVSSTVIYYHSTSGPVLVSTNSSACICLCCLNRKQSDPDFYSLKPHVTCIYTNLQTVTQVHFQIVVY